MNKTALATIGALFGAIAFAAPAKAFVYLDGGVAGVAPIGTTNDLFAGLYGGGPSRPTRSPAFISATCPAQRRPPSPSAR